jgi:uncharacterized protein YjbI with pentapeptide repeats
MYQKQNTPRTGTILTYRNGAALHLNKNYEDLSGADLREADLRGADLRKADLREADLREADLSGADLREADLREANLHGADLSPADLSGADLRGADLSRADLREADLRGADLREADLSRAGLRGAQYDKNTKFPTEFNCANAEMNLNKTLLSANKAISNTKPSSCFKLSSIKEFFKKVINFISCGMLCKDFSKNK